MGSITPSLTQAIPQADPRAGYLAHKAEIDQAIAAVLERGRYILGPEVAAFEQEFAAYLGVAHVIAVASGTDALRLALEACGIGRGDSVITVSHSAVATVAAIELTGARPVLAEIDPRTLTLDAGRLQDVRAKAIVPVHLYGHPADLASVMNFARQHGMYIIEDCAQSHGATIEGRKTGTWGHMAAFSFYPTKNLAALGDGGAVATNDPLLAERVRRLREYGWRQRYVSEAAGLNSRLDELQAAILRVKLRYLDRENARRRELAARYTELLSGTTLILPSSSEDAFHVYHQYVVRARRRDALKQYLEEHGVGALIHYPVPIHLQPAYKNRIPMLGRLVETERAAREVLSLPMYPELALAQLEVISEVIHEFERLES